MGSSQESSLFQCQPTTDQSGHVFTPNIPDLYFNDSNIVAFAGIGGNLTAAERSLTYVFTIPQQRVCSGTVLAIEYCYKTRSSLLNQNITIFNFLSLDSDFVVNSSFPVVSTPHISICTDFGNNFDICCDTATLDADNQPLQIPSSGYIFGVVPINDDLQLLGFIESVTEYQLEQSQDFIDSAEVVPGYVFILKEDSLMNGSIFLMRFVIGKFSKSCR